MSYAVKRQGEIKSFQFLLEGIAVEKNFSLSHC